jgi:hypothetical protein
LKGFKHFKVELAAQKKPPEGGFFCAGQMSSLVPEQAVLSTALSRLPATPERA